MREEKFMRLAIELSRRNVRENLGGPFAALVVRGDEVLAEGANRVTSMNDPTAHAEVVAIREACRKLNSFQLTGCEVYASCEPCPMCLGAIYWARPDAVYFAATKDDAAAAGFDDSFIYRELALPPDARQLPLRQLLRAEACAAFDDWARNPNKVPY